MTDPFPSPAVVEGTWLTVRTGHELVYLGKDRVLDWEPASGHYRIWRYDSTITQGDPLPGPAVVEGTWQTVRTGHELVYLGGDRVLDWEPVSGHYRVWRYDRTVTQSDPLPGPAIMEGTWQTIRTDHKLVPVPNYNIVIDWEHGRYRLWEYDPNQTSGDPLLPYRFFNPSDYKTPMPDIAPDSELLWLGRSPGVGFSSKARLLFWHKSSGDYFIHEYPSLAHTIEQSWTVKGTWVTIRSGHELIYLEGRVLDWEPASGHYRIWNVVVP